MRGAGAVIHSHGIETCIATMLNPGAKEFRVNPLTLVANSPFLYLLHCIALYWLQGLSKTYFIITMQDIQLESKIDFWVRQ